MRIELANVEIIPEDGLFSVSIFGVGVNNLFFLHVAPGSFILELLWAFEAVRYSNDSGLEWSLRAFNWTREVLIEKHT